MDSLQPHLPARLIRSHLKALGMASLPPGIWGTVTLTFQVFAQISSREPIALLKVARWLCTPPSPWYTWSPFLPCSILAFDPHHLSPLTLPYNSHIYCVYCLSTPTELEISWGHKSLCFVYWRKQSATSSPISLNIFWMHKFKKSLDRIPVFLTIVNIMRSVSMTILKNVLIEV